MSVTWAPKLSLLLFGSFIFYVCCRFWHLLAQTEIQFWKDVQRNVVAEVTIILRHCQLHKECFARNGLIKMPLSFTVITDRERFQPLFRQLLDFDNEWKLLNAVWHIVGKCKYNLWYFDNTQFREKVKVLFGNIFLKRQTLRPQRIHSWQNTNWYHTI